MPAVQPIGTAVTVTYDGVSAIGLRQSAAGNITPGITDEARDEGGSVADASMTDWRSAVDLNVIPYIGATFPVYNSLVTIAGFDNANMNGVYRTASVGEDTTNQGRPGRRFSFIRYLDNGLWSSTTTTTTT